MNVQENNGNILTGNKQVQSQSRQVQSGSEHAQYWSVHFQSRSEQAQTRIERAQSGSGLAQSSFTSMAAKLLIYKNKPREENKPVDKERQKVELEKSLEPIRRFNQINEEIKESYDKQDAKLKQRKEDVRESLRKTEAKYCPDLDLNSDLDQSKDQPKDLDSDLDLDSSDDFVYVNKPEIKINKFRCEACNQE